MILPVSHPAITPTRHHQSKCIDLSSVPSREMSAPRKGGFPVRWRRSDKGPPMCGASYISRGWIEYQEIDLSAPRWNFRSDSRVSCGHGEVGMKQKNSAKVAVITGATGGIGAAIARTLSQAGYSLVLSSTCGDKLNALAAQLSGPSVVIAGNLRA